MPLTSASSRTGTRSSSRVDLATVVGHRPGGRRTLGSGRDDFVGGEGRQRDGRRKATVDQGQSVNNRGPGAVPEGVLALGGGGGLRGARGRAERAGGGQSDERRRDVDPTAPAP